MNRSRLRRILALTATATLALAAVGAIPAAARTPDWAIDPVRLPVTVAPGNDAGYFVTVTNNGTSTINDAKLTVTPFSTPDATPTYFSGLQWISGGPEIDCTDTGRLVCLLGTMDAGDSVTFTVAYDVSAYSGGKFDVTFFLEAGTGNVGGKNNSRGDALAVTASTNVNTSTNFDGGFVIGDDTYETSGTLGRQNRQNSQIVVSDSLLPVTIQDGTSVQPSCDTTLIPECENFIGESTVIDVPSHDGLMKITMFIWGGAIPGGVGADEIVVIHDPDSGPTYAISTACDPATGTPTNAECLTVTKSGNNWKIVVWLNDNGTLRGGF